ncbi:LOW QUALITY PROTEIN: family with sequence similarity 171 member B [Phycodurus eques]|uniref:LOW QUALITY PROTEIN: family with sequence similarity 171 member B n=1 Tax=Phycodurus eques TaxID=693459 RepID=UPI002ACF054A|nr:LOW QUALITY PROTEIN: family with sequence similarity 171 member B [Phycodurus eques]
MPNAERRLTALLPPPPLLPLFVRSLLLISFDAPVGAADEGSGLPPSLPRDNGQSATTTGMFLVAPALTAEPQFPLKVLVRDMVTRQLLPGASVGLYVNHSLSSSTWTGEKGEALLWVPYIPLLSLTLVATMEGYVPSPLPWSTTKRPIFSAVTLLLLPQRQGNIWLFEDSVVITAKLPDSASQPKIKIPKKLLRLPDKSNVSSLTVYLTVPQLAKNCVNCTPGIIVNTTGFRSTGLKPVAAVSVLLYAGGEELQVRGPIQFSMPLGRSTHHRVSDTMPAWSFNLQTGAWQNQGLGIVKTLGEELVWTYTASHLGYWIAAPMPSNDHGSSLDFLSYHNLLLVGILAGTLVVVIGFLSLLLCQCRSSHREPRGRRARFSKLTVVKKDQTTSMHMEGGLLFHSGENILAPCNVQCDPLSTPRHKANYNIYVEDPASQAKAPLYENISTDRIKVPNVRSHYINNEEVSRLMEQMELNRSNINSDSFFPDKLVHIYNHPVAIIQAPDMFSNQEPQKAGCKSATFPRNGNDFDAEAPNKDSYAQTLGKVQISQQQSHQDEPQPLETPPPSQGSPAVWGRYSNLLESSVSVPGTLNEAAGMEGFSGAHGISSELQGISERTLLELTRGKSSSSHPRAWFVSLDGKPAAQVRHSIIELQSRHRPPSSNDTSLDSGVDMNEPQQNIREVRRERISIRASSLQHHSRSARYGEEQDLSSSESGTTTTDTPEDHYLRNILDGSSGTIPNIPEEQDGMDTSSTQEDSEFRETPPPRRLKKGKEKVKSEKRSTKHVREGRPLTKRR